MVRADISMPMPHSMINANVIFVDEKLIKDELLNILIAGRDTVRFSDASHMRIVLNEAYLDRGDYHVCLLCACNVSRVSCQTARRGSLDIRNL